VTNEIDRHVARVYGVTEDELEMLQQFLARRLGAC
jgi:hypothetical protein